MDRQSSQALEGLGRYLASLNYRFTAVTPATHQRVVQRALYAARPTLRDIFGWNAWFLRDDVPVTFDRLEKAGCIEREGIYCRSRVRFASVAEQLFVHSPFPTVATDSVFFGPDSYRFVSLIRRSLKDLDTPQTLVDIGCGSGVGGIVASHLLPGSTTVLTDINPLALSYAGINSALGRCTGVSLCQSDVLRDVQVEPSVIISNPPYMWDARGRSYRHGGEHMGSELSVRILHESMERLRPGGRLVLYTGTAITQGEDYFLSCASDVLKTFRCSYTYEEIDPDVFGEELLQPGYESVERIAAVGLVVTKN